MQKTYHVHLNPKAKEDYHFGSYYHVQRMHIDKAEKSEYGTMDYGTNSRVKLFLHLLKLRLQGYRKDQRKW